MAFHGIEEVPEENGNGHSPIGYTNGFVQELGVQVVGLFLDILEDGCAAGSFYPP